MCDTSTSSLLHVLHVKMGLVKSQTQELQASLESFINKISSDVTAMATEKLPASRIAEINSRLDASLALLMGKWPKINDINVDETVEDFHLNTAKTSVSAEQKELLAGIPELIQRVEKLETEIDKIMNLQQTKEADIQAAQMQILRIEEDLKTESVEKLNSEKDTNCRFESLNNRVKVLENDDRFSSLEKQFQLKLEDSDVKEHETRLNTIEDLIQTLQVNCSEVDKIVQNQSDEVQTLKKSVCDINLRQDRLESTSDNLSDSQDNLSSRVETAMDRLAMTKEETKYEKDFLKRKFSVFESKRQTDVIKLNELENLFNQVCQLMSTKVNPLCRLQDILSKHHATLKRNNIHTMVKTTVTKVNSLLPRVQKLELDTGKNSMGFTAYFHSQINVTKGSSLKFTDVRYNEGNHYSSVTGLFTATHEGVYLAAVTLNQSSEGSICVQIIQNSVSLVVRKVVCKAETNDNCVNSCGIGIAKLRAGDVVSVTVKDTQGNVSLSGYSSFSCVLIT